MSILKYPNNLASPKNRIRTRTLDLRKNGSIGKTEPQGLKTQPFFSRHMKDNF